MSEDKRYSIFLVDDDSKHLLLLKEHLSKHLPYDLNIQTFTSGEESLKHLKDNPEIVVLDYYFDEEEGEAKNGIEILKKIKQQKPELPVVMMSHQDKIEVAVNCYDYGARDYIIKNETAYMRAQLILRNIIHEIKKEEVLERLQRSTRTVYTILGSFIVILLGIIAYLILN